MRMLITLILCSASALLLLSLSGCPGAKVTTSPNVLLTVTPTTAPAGSHVVVDWSAPYGAKLVSSNFAATTPCGEKDLTPTTTATYTVVVSLPTGGDAQATGTFTVNSAAPVAPTVTLTASTPEVATGQPVTLTWSSTNADTVVSSNFSATAVSGSTSVSPTSSTNYTIMVSGPGGQISATAGVSVYLNKETNSKDGAAMVYVPAGDFLMGNSFADPDQSPEHTVYLDGYWIYENDVTVAEYRAYCTATNTSMPSAPSWGWVDDAPITNMKWTDATAYATWAGAQLPTEAQWEKAARGTDGRAYPWGNVWDPWDANKCNDPMTGPLATKVVGSYPEGASPYGAQDMLGNVWQWCADWYDPDYYPSAPITNPTGPPDGTSRVIRGSGCLARGTETPTCAQRRTVDVTSTTTTDTITNFTETDLGFRCVVPGP